MWASCKPKNKTKLSFLFWVLLITIPGSSHLHNSGVGEPGNEAITKSTHAHDASRLTVQVRMCALMGHVEQVSQIILIVQAQEGLRLNGT